MVEAVGLAASVIAIIDLSAKVATLCLQYSTAVGNAKADITRLQTRLDDLGTTLEGVQHLLEGRNNEALATSRKLADSLDGCMSELAQLQSRLDPGKAGKAMRRFGFRALKWPFHSKEVSGIVSNLERYEQTIMRRLQVDQTTILLDIHQKKEGASLQPEGSTSLARTPCFSPPDRDRDPSDRPDTSVAEPERRFLKEGYWKHGRFYGSWKPGKYLFPIDSEELNRLDIFHKVFLVARGNKPFHAPVMRQTPKIMDLGAGTGIWAINVAEECVLTFPNEPLANPLLTHNRYFSDAQIMAVDLNRTHSTLIPAGVIPKQYDIEEPLWSPLLADCDLIYMRMLFGSIQTDLWPQIYRKVFEHLTPGLGHIEHVEIDWTPRWDDDGKPANSSFQQWAQLFLAGMDQFNRSARITPEETRRMIAAAGFTDIRQEVIQAFVCPWSPDRRKQEIARWFNLALSQSLESLSMMPLIEKQGLKLEQVRKLCTRVKREICILRYHTYCNIYVWTARKPEWCAPAS